MCPFFGMLCVCACLCVRVFVCACMCARYACVGPLLREVVCVRVFVCACVWGGGYACVWPLLRDAVCVCVRGVRAPHQLFEIVAGAEDAVTGGANDDGA